jgi:hypothetical protein
MRFEDYSSEGSSDVDSPKRRGSPNEPTSQALKSIAMKFDDVEEEAKTLEVYREMKYVYAHTVDVVC